MATAPVPANTAQQPVIEESSSDDDYSSESEFEGEWMPPYNPNKNLFVRDKCKFAKPSQFSLKKQKQFRKQKATHIHLVSREWLSTKQAEELEQYFKFYRKKGVYTGREESIMRKELEGFMEKTGSTKEQIFEQLHKRKTAPLDLIIPVAEKLIWRDRTSVQRKLEQLCQPPGGRQKAVTTYDEWDEELDSTLIEAMQKPENKLEDGKKHSAAKWRQIAKQCDIPYPHRQVSQRWHQVLWWRIRRKHLRNLPLNDWEWKNKLDGTLIEVMQKPENKLEDGGRHSLTKWRDIAKQCNISFYSPERVRQRWHEVLWPRFAQNGHLSNMLVGDWVKLLKKLKKKQVTEVRTFDWKQVEFAPFSAAYLRKKYLDYMPRDNVKDAIKAELANYRGCTLRELNEVVGVPRRRLFPHRSVANSLGVQATFQDEPPAMRLFLKIYLFI